MRFRKQKRMMVALATTVLLVVNMLGLVPGPFSAKPALATSNTPSSTTSAAALYSSNWSDLMGIWMASKLSQNDTSTYGPRLGELRYSGDWTRNQIVDYTGFFRDETNVVKYNVAHNFASEGYYGSDGSIQNKYLQYNGANPPVNISKYYEAIPNQPFMLVHYTIQNPGASSITWNVLDQVHLNNPNRPTGSVTGTYDATRNALFGDLTGVGGGVVVLGGFSAVNSYQVGNDTDTNFNNLTSSPWYQFDNNGTLKNNASLTTADVDLAFQKSLTIGAGATTDLYFYITVRASMAAAQAASDTARAQTGSYWFTQANTSWTNWLNSGRRASTTDTGVNTAFDINLMTIKQMQNPTMGTIPAASNPISYAYGVWARDASVTAMALDATQHYAEAAKFWNWLASVQNADGSFHTKFDMWSGNYISFVEPEHDSLGMFLLGAYRHYALTSDSTFLSNIYAKLQKSANFLMNNQNGTYGFGPADASIWEETVEYNTFSQGMYIAGLYAAQRAANVQGNGTDRDNWNGSASTMLSALQRSYGWNPTGLYNETYGTYNRAVNTDFTPRVLVDGSSMAPIAWGVIDAASERAQTHAQNVAATLTRDTWGISRYTGDTYYYTSQYSPAGNEALGPEPAWPQLSMYMALYEIYTGQTANAFSRLQWYASRSGKGYTPPGEATSWVSGQPIVSTMAEPITAAAFLMTTLTYQGLFDPRITAPENNAGANKTLTVSAGTTGDWPQYSNVPYFNSQTTATQSGSTMTKIGRVYVTNDATNIYVRVDNTSGTLSGYNTEPKFALNVYSEDFNHGVGIASKAQGINGRTLDRPMQYMAGRWSDSASFSHFYVNANAWTWDYNNGGTAPQWDTTTGRIEAVIPIANFASGGSAPAGSWAYMDIALNYHNSGTGTWYDDDLLQLHYQLKAAGTAWTYGQESGNYIQNATVDKSHYTPGSTVNISVNVGNRVGIPITNGSLAVAFSRQGTSAGTTQSTAVNLAAGQVQTYNFTWSPPTTDYTGYKLDFTLKDSNNNVLDTSASAVDVSTNWTKYPRYGFMTNYLQQNPSRSNYDMQLLNDYHINGLQFYDWEWMHHIPLKGTVANPASTWTDINNRSIYRDTVNQQISAAHGRNMIAQQYNLAYGAWSGYGTDGSGVDYNWGMWYNNNCTSQAGFDLPPGWATPRMYWFDPNSTGWQNYIFGREDDVFSAYAFDGWHVDSFGDVGTVYACNGTLLNNAQGIANFLSAAKTHFTGKHITFNAVANFSTPQTLGVPLDFNYVENWERLGQTTYNDVKSIIDSNYTTTGKPTIMAAYMDYDYAKTTTTQQKLFSDPGIRFMDAMLFAAGGGHLEWGEGREMLDNEYFPFLKVEVGSSLRQALRDYYDFAVANEDTLYDATATANTKTISLNGITTSTNGTAGTVWTFAKSRTGMDVLHLLNLVSATTNAWRDANANMPAPTVQNNFVTKYYYGTGTVTGVKIASPDINHGGYTSLSYTLGSDGGGNYVQFTVPQLQYWDMILVQR